MIQPPFRFAAVRRVAWFIIGVIAFVCPNLRAGDVSKPPNVVLILADDFGYECVGANGGTSYRTPMLDRLATTGMRFEHCYVQPLCTPTRVQLMTGQYNVRNYITFGQMDPHAITFARLLQSAGYATCMAGKWQLGQDRTLPKRFGFDESYLWQHTRRPPRYANPGLEINGVEKDFTGGEYGPDLINEYACDFISRHKQGPFLLYYTMLLTHNPMQPTPDSPDWDSKAQGETVNQAPQHFGEMTAYLDKLVGKVIARLDELHIRDRTLILFLGDNGTTRGVRSMRGNRLVIGGKGSTTVTGMHVPLIANWPGRIKPGRVSADLVDSTDFLPTMCAAAGLTPPTPLDGRSFYKLLLGEPNTPRAWSYCWYSPRGETPQELAFNQKFRLGRDGTFARFDDLKKPQALDRSQLPPEAAATLSVLQGALDQFQNARPAAVSEATRQATKKGKTQAE